MAINKVNLPKRILHQTGLAIADYAMIKDGDRIMLGLSGGKDSMVLLHILLHLQKHAPIDFKLGAITVDPQMDEFEPAPLTPYLKSLNVEHHIISQPIQEQAKQHMHGNSFCSWCARIKCGIMYTTILKPRIHI